MRSAAKSLGKGLPVSPPKAISAAMKTTGAKISDTIARGRIALRDNTRALTSLLLLGLTRGCRVL
ncbi:hypothetical protein ATY75_14670 [Rhizobium sp. N122]|nr:hypothetical protein ATY75_14670 [Rhizobium sp. N122]